MEEYEFIGFLYILFIIGFVGSILVLAALTHVVLP